MSRHDTRSTCPYCGVGCGVIIEGDGTRITGVRGDPDHPANFGRLCSKGSTLHLTASRPIQLQTRLLTPQQRLQRGQTPQPIGWDAALDLASERFADVITRHGPDAVGFYVSGQLLTEDYYVFNKLAKGLIGTNNIDTNSRLCMSSAVAGYKQTLGADAPPACYDDLALADCLFIAGSNTAWAHPILMRRIEDARAARPHMKLVVVDPRRTETAALADLHLPIQPGTDVLLFHGMLHLMLWEGWTQPAYIQAHTSGFEALKARVRDCTPERVARTCGISPQALAEAARLFATSGATLSLYCQGLNQSSSGTAKNAALINLHLACAQIGRLGAGPFSLTGQPNAMGGREVGGLANLLPAHRDLANPAHRAEVAAAWGVPSVPERPGKTAVELFQAAADGEVRALWIACTNPAQSMPDQATVRRALERAEFVVVQEAFASADTCAWADLLLPATTWGEKDGTVTNSERRISRVRPAVPAPGQARHDWQIATAFGQRLAARLGRADLMPYATPEAVWNEHRDLTAGRDLDITGLSYAQLERAPEQWPYPRGATQGRARLYTDGVFATPDGRARFADVAYTPVAEPRNARHPFALTTGRLRDQWHGMTRTGTLGRLFSHASEPELQLHPQDMARRRLAEGALVRVSNARGSIVLPARASDSLGLSQAFIAMHWGGAFLSGRAADGRALAGINTLTSPATCPSSRQPELKHTAVRIEAADLPWTLTALAWLDGGDAWRVRAALRELMPRFDYASCVPFSAQVPLAEVGPEGEREGVLFRAAAASAPEPALLDALVALLGLNGDDTLSYRDRQRGQHRAARLLRGADGQATLVAVLLSGDHRGDTGGDTRGAPHAEDWVRELLQRNLPAQAHSRALLTPGLAAPQALPQRSPQVCSCHDVSEAALTACLARLPDDLPAAQRVIALQDATRCGTGCGSCLPRVRALAETGAATRTTAPAGPVATMAG